MVEVDGRKEQIIQSNAASGLDCYYWPGTVRTVKVRFVPGYDDRCCVSDRGEEDE